MNNLTMEELALVIKIQARIRGFLTRKKISAFKVSAGFGAHNFYGADGQILQNYDNPKVQEIRADLGEFDFNGNGTDGNRNDLEFRQMAEQPNHAKYEGDW